MRLNRRQFLKLSMVVAGSTAISPLFHYVKEPPQLPIPPLLEIKQGQLLDLIIQRTSWSFDGEHMTSAWGFNNHYLGPTIRVYSGDTLKLACTNLLSETIGLTLHGLLLPAAITNNASQQIKANQSWSPVLPIKQASATCWYHANTLHRMAEHVYRGLAGMWIVEDKNMLHLRQLPQQYGVDDFPLILQDKHFDFLGKPEYLGPYPEGFLGDTILTNGVIEPVLYTDKQWIRLRLLNASNARYYQLSLTDNHPIYLIANDQGLLETPITLDRITLAPGERKDILLDLTKISQLSLVSNIKHPLNKRLSTFFNIGSQANYFKVITIHTTERVIPKPEGLIKQLTEAQPIRYTAQRARTLHISRNGMINDRYWSAKRIDMEIKLNSQEYWTISVDLPQAFTIQGAQFQIIKVNNHSPTIEQSGWKDTVWIDRTVELLIRFNQRSSRQTPFLYYSQNLELADRGAKGQFVVM